jgi:hypothetical protein
VSNLFFRRTILRKMSYNPRKIIDLKDLETNILKELVEEIYCFRNFHDDKEINPRRLSHEKKNFLTPSIEELNYLISLKKISDSTIYKKDIVIDLNLTIGKYNNIQNIKSFISILELDICLFTQTYCPLCRFELKDDCVQCKIDKKEKICPVVYGQCYHMFHKHCAVKYFIQDTNFIHDDDDEEIAEFDRSNNCPFCAINGIRTEWICKKTFK